MTERWGKFTYPLLKCSKKILHRDIPHSLFGEKLKALALMSYVVKWYLRFLMDRKKRLIFKGVIYKCMNKGTTQGSVSGPHLLNLFINDLAIKKNHLTSIVKYADDITYPASQSM